MWFDDPLLDDLDEELDIIKKRKKNERKYK
jgi:hypothetical protein